MATARVTTETRDGELTIDVEYNASERPLSDGTLLKLTLSALEVAKTKRRLELLDVRIADQVDVDHEHPAATDEYGSTYYGEIMGNKLTIAFTGKLKFKCDGEIMTVQVMKLLLPIFSSTLIGGILDNELDATRQESQLRHAIY